MKYFNNIFGYCAAAMAVCSVFGCKQEELYEPDALMSAQSITFKAEAAEPQALTIASNGSWMIDVEQDWITVSPMSGTGSADVTVTVTDNVGANGVLNAPREGTIAIYSERGSSVSTTVIQEGDNYFGVGEYTVTQVANDLNDEDKAKISEAHVIALSSDGCIVTDGTTCLYVKDAGNITAGDIISLNGARSTENGLPVFIGDEVTVLSNEEYKYPTPTDITADLDSYKSKEVAYVSVEGTLVGTELKNIPDSPKTGVTVVTPHESIDLSGFNVHKVVLTGYYVGISGNGNINIVVTSVKDNGEDWTIGTDFPFNDDFSWLTPFIEAANAMLPADKQISDCVGNVITSADGAANIYTTLADGNVLVLEELRNRGYTDLNPDMETIYLQDAYLKFGANNKQSGLVLPLMRMDGAQDIQVSFRWCCHMGGTNKVDDVKLVVEIDGPGTVVTNAGTADAKISDEIVSTQKTGQMFWMDAAVKISGATNATFITIRPNPIGSSDNAVSGYHRYYLDDISVIPASAAVPATISVSGLDNANLITFEGTPENTVSFDVTSDMDFTISASAKWFTIDVTEGLAGETKTVTVACEPSTLSSLRNGSITIKSGTSTYTINVVQSAAGGELDPLISLSTGNNITVLGEGETFSTSVQANVEYEVEIEGDWITEEPAVSTMAVVEKHEYSFTAATNMTGSDRTGQIRFYNEEYGIESVLTVKQENFVPRVTVTNDRFINAIGGQGATLDFNVDANIPYTVSADSWIHLPASSGTAGEYRIPVTFDANTSASERTGTVTFTNETYGYEMKLAIRQYPSGVFFVEDFEWLEPWSQAGDNKGKPAGQTVENDDLDAYCPQLPTPKVDGVSALEALEAKGYQMLRVWADGKSESECIYLQRNYLKFGKTSYQAGIVLPSIEGIPTGETLNINFDWCPMRQGSGKLDPVNLIVEVTNGNDVKTFNVETYDWENGHVLEWISASVSLKGATVTKDTKITIKQQEWGVSTANRWFLDNIRISAE